MDGLITTNGWKSIKIRKALAILSALLIGGIAIAAAGSMPAAEAATMN